MEQEQNSQGPRLILFVVLSSLLLFTYPMIARRFMPPPPVAEQKKDAAQDDKEARQAEPQPGVGQPGGAPGKGDAPADVAKNPAAPGANNAPPANNETERYATLGSADPASGYRMLVTLTNRGAAVEQIELNHPRYADVTHRETKPLEDKGGWIGYLSETSKSGEIGCRVRVVGPGTPAEAAGLKPGDLITKINEALITSDFDYRAAMFQSRAGKPIEVTYIREGAAKTVSIEVRPRPVKIVQAEGVDPLSFLMTFDSLEGRTIETDKREIAGVALLSNNWQTAVAENEVTFTMPLEAQGLEIVKRYRLAKAPPENVDDRDYDAYHLELTVEIRNRSTRPQALAYRLDGPTGLPIEGYWYAQKISRSWFDSCGMRDVVGAFRNGEKFAFRDDYLVSCDSIIKVPDVSPNIEPKGQALPLAYAGVDALYFSAVMLPTQESIEETRFAKAQAIRVGEIPLNPQDRRLTNVSCRLVSQTATLEPGADLKHDFRIFAGPKRPALLAKYGLDELVHYGWFGITARPLLGLMHFFYGLVGNYGIAIVMLTVVVRSCMFPISRKQALNAQKMQELQPELKKITEKYKSDMEKRAKAQQELFAKHNYHPVAGCLPVFLHFPIFIGLYRSLALDVELRHSPLIPGVSWASNLCAPDMLWYWEHQFPAWFVGPQGWLGPYLNILPLVTLALFMIQQKKMMPAPDPNDEQAVMQQKVMKYMMIFMGVMFFKVAAGLCVYFIASSLWSMAERKWLPKPKVPVTAGGTGTKVIDVAANKPSNGSDTSSRKKSKDKR